MKRITHTNDSLKATEFIQRCSGWHSYGKDKRTIKAVKRAEFLGAVETNEFNQFRAKR